MYAEIDGQEVKLYGTIWDGDGPYIVSSLKALLAKKEPVTIHVHSPGGSVIDGNLIFNLLASSKTDTTIIIDGLAASMMSIIMTAGATVKMASNAFIMIHAPSGTQRGNAKSFESIAKVLRAMETDFIKRLGARTGKKAADLKEWMNGDNWFTADEALEAGLIDEVIDPIDAEMPEMAAYQDLKLTAQLFAQYDQEDEEEEEPTSELTPKNKPKITPKNQVEMKISAESLTILGLTPEATDQEINAAIAASNQKMADMEAKRVSEQTAKAEKLITDAIASGKILGSEKEAYLADAKSNYDLTERMLAKVPGKASLTEKQKVTTTTEADGSDKWTHADWRKKDTKGLLAMKATDPERYKGLCEAAGIKLD